MNDPSLKIEKALFPVSQRKVFVESDQKTLFDEVGVPEFVPLDFYSAIIADDTHHVFAVVTGNYRLVTNAEAIKLGNECFDKVFQNLKSRGMELFNVIMPKTRSFCHLDYVHPEAKFEPFEGDSWSPYVRITNSYNRMYALNFDLGFCRGICRNGVIFGQQNIEFKFIHTHDKQPEVEFHIEPGKLAMLEGEFIAALHNLQRFHVPTRHMWPLLRKVFEYKMIPDSTPKQRQLLEDKRQHVSALTEHYFSSLGENAYAALNVLTDFASQPVGTISGEAAVDGLQRKIGAWIPEFIESVSDRSFSFDRYLSNY